MGADREKKKGEINGINYLHARASCGHAFSIQIRKVRLWRALYSRSVGVAVGTAAGVVILMHHRPP